MKNRIKTLFLGLLLVWVLIFGIDILIEYWGTHPYYADMLLSRENWEIFICAIISAMIPIVGIIILKNVSLKKFLIRLWISLVFFSILYMLIKESFIGSGLIIYIVNISILFWLGIYTIIGVFSRGNFISHKIVKFKTYGLSELFINFGIGLGSLLLFVRILIGFGIFYPLITWLIFLSFGFIFWYQRKKISQSKDIITKLFNNLIYIKGWHKIAFLILLCISIIYFFYGFQGSFIPYSTAWDANHAYMYIPKVIANNHGLLRGNIGVANSMPFLWHSFISFRFSLIKPIQSWFWLSADNIAISMNFRSGIFVLLFSLGLINSVVNYFKRQEKKDSGMTNMKKNNNKIVNKTSKKIDWPNTGLVVGRAIMLLWLTSGMGAFLVFVDNKTDLGVMSLALLAILSGFVVLNYVKRYLAKNKQNKEFLDKKEIIKYLVISGLLFTLAIIAKPIAFIDMTIFVVLILSLWFNIGVGLGLGTIIVGSMGLLQMRNTPDFMSVGLGKIIILIGVIILISGIISVFIQTKNKKKNILLLRYFLIWGIVFIGSLVLLKGPWLAYNLHITERMGARNFTMGLLSANIHSTQNEKDEYKYKFLSSEEELGKLQDQKTIDQELSQQTQVDFKSCKNISYSKEELAQDLIDPVVGNEDIGRYVGYGWKDISKGSLGYFIMRTLYPTNNKCYGLNHDAKILCNNLETIDNFDIQALKLALSEMKGNNDAAKLLQQALEVSNELNTSGSLANPSTMNDHIIALRTYYENHSVKTEKGILHIPYRYIIPMNITFNRSLQNASSYYTDIGFVRLILFGIIVLSLLYAIIKRDKKILALSVSTIVGRALRYTIAGAIVWYGIGLMMRTALVSTIFIIDIGKNTTNKQSQILYYIILILLGLRIIIQISLNFIRMSSQGSKGPFMRYKQSIGNVDIIQDDLQVQRIQKLPYLAKDIFNLQFGHYNYIINETQGRDEEDGLYIAGTYLPYFLDEQRNIKYDGLLTRLAKQTSDSNVCKIYHRLKENNIKYIVIDPNIGTVVMGEGNESLFHRFFAKLNPSTGTIDQHGTISSLQQLHKYGYINLLSTNNLGAKYAIELSDQDIQNSLNTGTGSNLSEEDIDLIRSKLLVAKFFVSEDGMYNIFLDAFSQRLANGAAMSDLASIQGKVIDNNKLIQVASFFFAENNNSFIKTIKELNNDERSILSNYLGLITMAQNNHKKYSNTIHTLIKENLVGKKSQSQLIIFKLK